MWAWLNPLNLIKIFGLVKGLADLLIAGYNLIAGKITEYNQKKKIETIEKAESSLSKANEIQNDEERLKAKAHAAKDLEDSLNP